MKDAKIRSLLSKVISPELMADAVYSLSLAQRRFDTHVASKKRKAPFVMLPVCLKLDWDAEKLPAKYADYDNNISINGDSATTYHDEQGRRRRNIIPTDPNVFFHSDGTRIQYWTFKRFHARHWWSRYVWLGWRNRASAVAAASGIAVAPDAKIVTHYKVVESRFKTEELLVNYVDFLGITQLPVWQLRRQVSVGPFRFIQNLGFKLNNLNDIDRVASVTWIPWSLKIGKPKPIHVENL